MKRLLILLAACFALFGGVSNVRATTTPITHVVLIMEENHSYSAAMAGMPYLKSLATTYASGTNYWATNFPSLPNYMALTSGHAVPAKDCIPSSSCQSTYPSIFGQIPANWRVLAESEPSDCSKINSGNYAPRHTAAPYYTELAATCKTYDVPYSASTTPDISAAFTLVAPNLVHDAHSGTLAAADTWLKAFMAKVLASSQYQSGNTLVEIVFDSGAPNCGASCPSQVPAVLVNPQLSKLALTGKYTHYSMLRLNEELLGLPLLGSAQTAADMRPALGL